MSIKTAGRMASVHGFGIDRVAREAEQVSTRWPVLRMENLDTDLPLPPEAIPVTSEALGTAKANSWLPFTGDDDLRAAIAELLLRRTGHAYDPGAEVVVTSGGTEAALDCLLATVDPGDEVVLTDPTYAGLVNRVLLVGGVPRFVPFRVIDGEWRLDRDALVDAIGPATKALLLWVAGPRPLIEAVGWAHVYNTTTPVGIARAAATAVLRGDHGHIDDSVAELTRRRDTILNALPGLPFVRPSGGWSLLLDVLGLGIDPQEASRSLLRDAAIAATPMTGWGATVAARHVRFVFSAEPVERLATLPERFATLGWIS